MTKAPTEAGQPNRVSYVDHATVTGTVTGTDNLFKHEPNDHSTENFERFKSGYNSELVDSQSLNCDHMQDASEKAH
jgi:hypothetical protein